MPPCGCPCGTVALDGIEAAPEAEPALAALADAECAADAEAELPGALDAAAAAAEDELATEACEEALDAADAAAADAVAAELTAMLARLDDAVDAGDCAEEADDATALDEAAAEDAAAAADEEDEDADELEFCAAPSLAKPRQFAMLKKMSMLLYTPANLSEQGPVAKTGTSVSECTPWLSSTGSVPLTMKPLTASL